LKKRKKAQEKKGSCKRKKAQKNPGAVRGNFRGAKKWLRHAVPRENARREWPSTFSMTYPFCPAPPPAPPLQDFEGVRGRFKKACLNRLRRCGLLNKKGCQSVRL